MMGGRVTAYANLGTAVHRVAHLKARAFSQVAVQGVQPIVVFKDEVVWPRATNAIDLDNPSVADSQNWGVAWGAQVNAKVQALPGFVELIPHSVCECCVAIPLG